MDYKVSEFVNRIRGITDEGDDSLLRAATVRMSIALLARIEALAEMAKTSRNTAMVQFLELGQAAVWDKLTEEEQQVVNESAAKKIAEMFKSGKKE